MYKLIGIIALLSLSSCYLSEKHFDDVVNLDSNIKQLDKKDQQMQQDLEAIKAAAQKKSQGENR